MSPPYTPYSQDHTFYDESQTPSNCFSQIGTIVEKTMIGTELNGSPTYSAAYNMPNSYNQMTFSSNVTTHTYDHMNPSLNYGMPSRNLPLPHMQASGQFATSATTTGNHPTMVTNRILTMEGHVTHFGSVSSTPSPLMEPNPLLFPTVDNSSSISNKYQLNEPVFQSTSVAPSLAQAPSRVKQSVITETRARYSGTTPINGGGQNEMRQVRGHIPRSTGGHDPNTDAASQSISQWSQWLKNGAPEPVC